MFYAISGGVSRVARSYHMRAVAVFPERRELRIIEVPTPTVKGDHDVLVRVREVGICGTDREICEFVYGAPAQGRDALILGHEALGEVVEIGARVRTLERGDLVAITVRRPCVESSCMACRAEREDFCATGRFRERGIKGADGFMTDFIVEDERYLVRVPDELADVGVLMEPLTVAAKAALELETILKRFPWEREHLRALVLGAGPIGILSAMMFAARNATTVVYSRERATGPRAELLRSFKAEYVSAEDTPLEQLASHGGPFNIILEAVGNARVAFGAMNALAPNGVCVFSGLPMGDKPMTMNLDGIMRNIVLENQMILGTVNASRAAFEAAVRYLGQFMTLFPQSVRNVITDRVSLEKAPELLRTPGGIKQVLTVAT
jgi:threonine dehydrogenase-like Zn-dependent dehydrogenase